MLVSVVVLVTRALMHGTGDLVSAQYDGIAGQYDGFAGQYDGIAGQYDGIAVSCWRIPGCSYGAFVLILNSLTRGGV